MIRSQLTLRRTLVVVVAAFALFATACGGSDAAVAVDSQDADAAPAEAAAPEASAADAEPAISLVASTVDGGQIDFGSLEGQDVVLWFWAPW